MENVTFMAKIRTDKAVKIPYEAREALNIGSGDILVLTVERVIKKR